MWGARTSMRLVEMPCASAMSARHRIWWLAAKNDIASLTVIFGFGTAPTFPPGTAQSDIAVNQSRSVLHGIAAGPCVYTLSASWQCRHGRFAAGKRRKASLPASAASKLSDNDPSAESKLCEPGASSESRLPRDAEASLRLLEPAKPQAESSQLCKRCTQPCMHTPSCLQSQHQHEVAISWARKRSGELLLSCVRQVGGQRGFAPGAPT